MATKIATSKELQTLRWGRKSGDPMDRDLAHLSNLQWRKDENAERIAVVDPTTEEPLAPFVGIKASGIGGDGNHDYPVNLRQITVQR